MFKNVALSTFQPFDLTRELGRSESVSEHKNKLIFAVAIAAISVIILGTVSYVFLPLEPSSQGSLYQMWTRPASWPLSTIVIANDGSVNSTALLQTGEVYTQTRDIINQTILVQKNDIVLDGSGYSLQGSGISLQERNNVTITNMQFTNANSIPSGITLNESSNCIITGNSVLKTPNIISLWLYLENSSVNIISGNNVTMGNIELMFSSNNTIDGNTITDVQSEGISLIWSQNNDVTNNRFEKVLTPVEVQDNDNIISENNMVNCDQGVRVLGSSNTVFGNNMTFADLGYNQQGGDWMTGIVVDGSNNTVYQNIVQGFALAGISINGGSNTVLSDGTRIPGVGVGNSFFGNIVACNRYGILIGPEGYTEVNNNTIFQNDFINNYQNAFVCSPQTVNYNDGTAYYVNFWDNGREGNYWSDYLQTYPVATEIGSSGIMSAPYLIDSHNSDMHPLENPYMSENASYYPNPFAGQTLFSYAIRQTQPFPGDVVAAQNRNNIYIEFYTLPPNVTLQLSPSVSIANVTTTLRAYTFNLAESLLASTNYTATVIFGDGSNTQSYTWNFTTPSYS